MLPIYCDLRRKEPIKMNFGPKFSKFMIDKISGEEMYMRTYDVAENRWRERGVWTKCPNIIRLKDACKALLTVCLS